MTQYCPFRWKTTKHMHNYHMQFSTVHRGTVLCLVTLSSRWMAKHYCTAQQITVHFSESVNTVACETTKSIFIYNYSSLPLLLQVLRRSHTNHRAVYFLVKFVFIWGDFSSRTRSWVSSWRLSKLFHLFIAKPKYLNHLSALLQSSQQSFQNQNYWFIYIFNV